MPRPVRHETADAGSCRAWSATSTPSTWIVICCLCLGLAATSDLAGGQASGLRIVIVDGEDAVNIIQQNTAVAPLIEVRDRNDQPVAGAVVTFAIRNGRATFSGARTLTVTTNAAGRAAATGFAPTGPGALQISASATFQGQTAVATIAQTNMLTAQAAQVAGSTAGSSGGGTATGAGGTAGGSGGGLSTTTIGIVGGVAAGGAIAAAKVLGVVGGAAAGGAIAAAKVLGVVGGRTHYRGQFSGPETEGAGLGCERTFTYTGTVEMGLDVADGGMVTGDAEVHGNWEMTVLAATCIVPLDRTGGFDVGMPVNGTAGQLAFNKEQVNNYPSGPFATNGGFITETFSFTGSIGGDTITGTLFHRQVNRLNQSTFVEEGSASFPVTLR